MLQFGNISFDSILWFFASGKSFFLGLLLLVITSIVPGSLINKWTKYLLYILRALGLLLIVLSTTPLHPAFYILGLILLLGSYFRNKKQTLFKILIVVFGLMITFIELPHHISPTISTNNIDCIYVIGDSVSAGIGSKNEQTWPELLEKEINIKTINLAQAGATVESALKQSSHITAENCLIILEIGGNDLLGYTSLNAFETSCNQLLGKLSSWNQIVWLELPLLPQYYPYGRIQRTLARKYDITLVPKTVLAKVFSTEGATSDGIHLTQEGHRVMALEMQKLIKRD